MFSVSGYTDSAVKDICYNCGSSVAKRSYNYFRRIAYVSGGKVWSKVWSKGDMPIAFYYATKCRDHVRLIEIAVHSDWQKKGLGRMVLYDLLAQMKRHKILKLTFRTPITEEAIAFWLHIGAKIMDVNGNDYEMELTIR